MATTEFRPSPLALAVLGLLVAGPLHPYGIQRLMKLWGKDNVVNVGNRANLYKTIRRLHDAGLIAVHATERNQLYPERTVYELTDRGRRAGPEWLVDMVATPRDEFPEFPAALSFAMLLAPDDLRAALERRADTLEANLSGLDAEAEATRRMVPRVALLEDEYRSAILAAELQWVRGAIRELRTGTLSWNGDELESAARSSIVEASTAVDDPDGSA